MKEKNIEKIRKQYTVNIEDFTVEFVYSNEEKTLNECIINILKQRLNC